MDRRDEGALPPLTAFARGVLCIGLVCLAVWMAMAGRGVADKAVAVLFPVTAFVAAGFEHSVANWFFLPFGMMHGADVTVGQVIGNLVTVTAGNIVGGTLLVAAVYRLAYLRVPKTPRGRRPRPSPPFGTGVDWRGMTRFRWTALAALALAACASNRPSDPQPAAEAYTADLTGL